MCDTTGSVLPLLFQVKHQHKWRLGELFPDPHRHPGHTACKLISTPFLHQFLLTKHTVKLLLKIQNSSFIFCAQLISVCWLVPFLKSLKHFKWTNLKKKKDRYCLLPALRLAQRRFHFLCCQLWLFWHSKVTLYWIRCVKYVTVLTIKLRFFFLHPRCSIFSPEQQNMEAEEKDLGLLWLSRVFCLSRCSAMWPNSREPSNWL